jgi:hypothetical protein
MDPVMNFETPEAIANHLNAAIAEGGANQLLYALSEVILTKSDKKIAPLSKLQSFSVVHSVIHDLGLRIMLTPMEDAACR